jgi:hypothetical protein
LLEQLSKNSKVIAGLQSDIIAVKEYASDLQTFLGSKVIEKKVLKEQESLMALSDDGCLQQLNLRYNINTKKQDILSTITTFGSVSIETSPPSVVIKTMNVVNQIRMRKLYNYSRNIILINFRLNQSTEKNIIYFPVIPNDVWSKYNAF